MAHRPHFEGKRLRRRVEYERGPSSPYLSAYAAWVEAVNAMLVAEGHPGLFDTVHGPDQDERQASCDLVDALCEKHGLKCPWPR